MAVCRRNIEIIFMCKVELVILIGEKQIEKCDRL